MKPLKRNPNKGKSRTEWPWMAFKKFATFSSSSSSFPFSSTSASISVWTSQIMRISVWDLHIRSHTGDSLHYMESSSIILNTAGNIDLLRVPATGLPQGLLCCSWPMWRNWAGEEEHKEWKISTCIWITDGWDFGTSWATKQACVLNKHQLSWFSW